MQVHEHIASQVVMSAIDPDVTVRSSTTSGGFSDSAYEKLTVNRADTSIRDSPESQQPPTQSLRLAADSKLTLTKLLKSIYDHMEQVRYRIQKDTYRQCVSNEWLLVGTLVDKILFFVYCSIVIFCTLTIFKNN